MMSFIMTLMSPTAAEWANYESLFKHGEFTTVYNQITDKINHHGYKNITKDEVQLRAESAMKIGKSRVAIKDLNYLLSVEQIKAKREAFHQLLFKAYMNIGNYSNALSEAQKVYPATSEEILKIHEGMLYQNLSSHTATTLTNWVKLSPESIDALYTLALYFRNVNNGRKFMKVINKILEIDHKNMETLQLLASFHQCNGNYSAAKRVVQYIDDIAVRMIISNGTARCQIFDSVPIEQKLNEAHNLIQTGLFSEAFDTVISILKHNPINNQALSLKNKILESMIPNMKETDPFVILGVSYGTTQSEALPIYRKLARMWHPDSQPTALMKAVAEIRMAAINSAFENLPKYDKPHFAPTEDFVPVGIFMFQ